MPLPRRRRAEQLFHHERDGHPIAPHLAQGDVHYVAQYIPVEDARDGIAHIEHQHPQAAVRFIGTRAALVGRHTHAGNRGERAVDEPDDLAEADFLRRLGEEVAAGLAPLRLDEAGTLRAVAQLRARGAEAAGQL